MRKLIISFLAIIFLSAFVAPAFATPKQQPLPSWLVEAEARPMADFELDTVQGEFAFVTLATIVCGAAAVLTLAEIAYLHYKLATGKSFTSDEKRFLNDVCGVKIPQYPNAPKELRWIQGR